MKARVLAGAPFSPLRGATGGPNSIDQGPRCIKNQARKLAARASGPARRSELMMPGLADEAGHTRPPMRAREPDFDRAAQVGRLPRPARQSNPQQSMQPCISTVEVQRFCNAWRPLICSTRFPSVWPISAVLWRPGISVSSGSVAVHWVWVASVGCQVASDCCWRPSRGRVPLRTAHSRRCRARHASGVTGSGCSQCVTRAESDHSGS